MRFVIRCIWALLLSKSFSSVLAFVMAISQILIKSFGMERDSLQLHAVREPSRWREWVLFLGLLKTPRPIHKMRSRCLSFLLHGTRCLFFLLHGTLARLCRGSEWLIFLMIVNRFITGWKSVLSSVSSKNWRNSVRSVVAKLRRFATVGGDRVPLIAQIPHHRAWLVSCRWLHFLQKWSALGEGA